MREDEPRRVQGEGRAGEKHVAEPEEVLSYLTDVLRGEAGEELKNSTARMRAAELLGRKLGMFAEAGAEGAMEPAENTMVLSRDLRKTGSLKDWI